MASSKSTGRGVFTRIEPKQHKALQRLAKTNGRSMAGEARVAIDEYVERHKRVRVTT
jgi:hypothetical protein